MRYLWDEPKRRLNLATHGLDFEDAADRFDWQGAIFRPAHPGSRGETRTKAIGLLDGRPVALVFSMLGEQGMSFISLRPASRTERRLHHERRDGV